MISLWQGLQLVEIFAGYFADGFSSLHLPKHPNQNLFLAMKRKCHLRPVGSPGKYESSHTNVASKIPVADSIPKGCFLTKVA